MPARLVGPNLTGCGPFAQSRGRQLEHCGGFLQADRCNLTRLGGGEGGHGTAS